MVLIDKRSSQLEAARNRLQTLVEETNTDEFEESEEDGEDQDDGEDGEEVAAGEEITDEFEFERADE